MRLLDFLVSGVRGAESGTATFVLRGTASSALSVMFTDFEGTAQPASNIITLDSNGAAEIYVNAYVDVTLKTSAGVTLRTVTVGDTSTCVEVRSDSFTGVDYSGSPTAVNQPITLQAVLNLWNNSAGATDFQVNPGSGAVNISSALADISGMFTNVKSPTFGAVGDGVTNDTTAINNAITAAAGGIVFFPPGTYIVTALTAAVANVTFFGCGPGSSIISGSSAVTRMLNITDNTSGGWKRFIGIKFTSSAAYETLIDLEETQNVYFENCEFVSTNCTVSSIRRPDVDGQTNVFIDNCKFTSGTGVDGEINNLSDDGESFFSVKNCFFTIPALFTGIVFKGPDFNVSGCEVDASAVTAGTYYHVNCASNETAGLYLGSFSNNKFIDGGSSGFVFDLRSMVSSSIFSEESNTFSGYADPLLTAVGRIYDISYAAGYTGTGKVCLGSRKGKSIFFTNSSTGTVLVLASRIAENIFINHTGAGILDLQLTASLPVGCDVKVHVINNSGGTRDITFIGQNQSGTSSESNTVNITVGQMASCGASSFATGAAAQRTNVMFTHKTQP